MRLLKFLRETGRVIILALAHKEFRELAVTTGKALWDKKLTAQEKAEMKQKARNFFDSLFN